MGKRVTKTSPEMVDVHACAEEFGVSPNSVRVWATDGCPHQKINKRLAFNLAAVADWRRSTGKNAHSRSNTNASPDLESARLRKENALADKHELFVARERGLLIKAADAKRTYCNFVRVMRNRVQRVGVAVTTRWGDPDAARRQADIDNEITSALADVSQTNESDDGTMAVPA